MLREDEKDKRERAKIREQQRKRQTLLDQRDNLEQVLFYKIARGYLTVLSKKN